MTKENLNIEGASETKIKINGIFRHIKDTGHNIAWEKVEFLDFDQRTPCRKMKESVLIDIHAAIDGVMNPRDGTQKDACWNCFITILKKS